MKRLFTAALFAAALLWPGLAAAQTVGVAVRGGTLGVGGDLSVELNRFLGLRGGLGTFPVQPEGDIEEVNYKIKPPSSMLSAGVDLYPLGGNFRLSGGLLFKHDVRLDATANTNFTFNDVEYTPQQAGTVRGDITWSSTSPFASFGWAGRGKGFGLTFDLGAVFMGEPDILLSAHGGSLSSDAAFLRNLRAAQDSAQTNAGKYLKVLPIVQLGIRIGL